MTPPTSLGLSAQGLRCVRDERVLFESLDLNATPGEILLIEGENGSGKTSLLRILAGLSLAEIGEIYWEGVTIGDCQTEFAADMAFLGHQTGIKEDLTPMENLDFLMALHPSDREAQSQSALINLLIKKMGLYGFEDVLCRNLSAGQKRRVALTRLLASDKKLWILDEPFTAIDKQGVAFIEQAICQFGQSGGIVVLTTHHELELPNCEPKRIRLS